MHKSKYFASSPEPTVSAALWHNSLASEHPDSLQRFEMDIHISCTSLGSKAALFERTRRHISLARTHVLTYLMRSRISSRSFFRLISKEGFLTWQEDSKATVHTRSFKTCCKSQTAMRLVEYRNSSQVVLIKTSYQNLFASAFRSASRTNS